MKRFGKVLGFLLVCAASIVAYAASAATDYVVVMNQQTPAGAAVTMAATYADGGNGKLIIGANLARDFSGKYIPAGSDGPHEIQIQAVGHGCKMALIRKHYPN